MSALTFNSTKQQAFSASVPEASVSSLHVEANEMPLELRQRRLAAHYCLKVSADTSNPAVDYISFHLLPHVSLRLGMFEMPQDKGEEHDSVLDPTFEDTTCEQSHIQPNHSPV